MSYPEGVSLIICTYNGAERLPVTIGHINKEKIDPNIPWELIVIDNASDDASSKVALDSWKLEVPVRVFVENEKGLIYARYRGIKEARYEYISFIDDDNWIDPNWIQNIYNIFKSHPEVGVCGSRNYGAFEKTPPDWLKSIVGSYAIGDQGKETGDVTNTRGYVWGAGMSFRKSVFEKLLEAGFKSVLTGRKGKNLAAGEDTELAYAFRLAGWRIWYDEMLTLQHYIPSQRFDWKYLVKIYKGFGNSHAIFDIYRLVLNNKPYQPKNFYKRLFRDYWIYFKMRWQGKIQNNEGSLDYLKYTLNKAKLYHSLHNFNKNKHLYNRISDFRKNIISSN